MVKDVWQESLKASDMIIILIYNVPCTAKASNLLTKLSILIEFLKSGGFLKTQMTRPEERFAGPVLNVRFDLNDGEVLNVAVRELLSGEES